ncbi:MAG: N-acetyltransferase [Chloroflexota bacterium]
MATIRPAMPDDLPHIIALDQEIFGSYGADESPEVIRARLDVFPEGCVVLEDISTSDEVESSLIGYLTTEKWLEARDPVLDEDPYFTHNPDGQVLCVTTLAIAPAFQNQKLGPLLVKQAATIARRERCDQIVLETAHAQKFYLRQGFEAIGERQERGIKLYIMRLDV